MSETNPNNPDNNTNEPANILNRNTQYRTHRPHQYKERNINAPINQMYQLTSLEKEKVRVLFREAYVKGFRMDQIPEFIFIKSKLNVTYSLCKTLKEMQYEDDRFWFYELARDSTAYMGIYRLAIDKLTHLETELWRIIINPKEETSNRIMATREAHSINKTNILLARDLPFITNLSKMYDLSDMDPKGQTIRRLQRRGDLHSNHKPDFFKREFSKDTFDDINKTLVQSILDRTKDTKRIDTLVDDKENNRQVDKDVMEDMQRQFLQFGYESDPEVKEYREREKQKAEELFIEKNLAKFDRELTGITSEDEGKVVKIVQEYRKNMDYLEHFIPRKHREAISKIREITDQKEDKEQNDDTTG